MFTIFLELTCCLQFHDLQLFPLSIFHFLIEKNIIKNAIISLILNIFIHLKQFFKLYIISCKLNILYLQIPVNHYLLILRGEKSNYIRCKI